MVATWNGRFWTWCRHVQELRERLKIAISSSARAWEVSTMWSQMPSPMPETALKPCLQSKLCLPSFPQERHLAMHQPSASQSTATIAEISFSQRIIQDCTKVISKIYQERIVGKIPAANPVSTVLTLIGFQDIVQSVAEDDIWIPKFLIALDIHLNHPKGRWLSWKMVQSPTPQQEDRRFWVWFNVSNEDMSNDRVGGDNNEAPPILKAADNTSKVALTMSLKEKERSQPLLTLAASVEEKGKGRANVSHRELRHKQPSAKEQGVAAPSKAAPLRMMRQRKSARDGPAEKELQVQDAEMGSVDDKEEEGEEEEEEDAEEEKEEDAEEEEELRGRSRQRTGPSGQRLQSKSRAKPKVRAKTPHAPSPTSVPKSSLVPVLTQSSLSSCEACLWELQSEEGGVQPRHVHLEETHLLSVKAATSSSFTINPSPASALIVLPHPKQTHIWAVFISNASLPLPLHLRHGWSSPKRKKAQPAAKAPEPKLRPTATVVVKAAAPARREVFDAIVIETQKNGKQHLVPMAQAESGNPAKAPDGPSTPVTGQWAEFALHADFEELAGKPSARAHYEMKSLEDAMSTFGRVLKKLESMVGGNGGLPLGLQFPFALDGGEQSSNGPAFAVAMPTPLALAPHLPEPNIRTMSSLPTLSPPSDASTNVPHAPSTPPSAHTPDMFSPTPCPLTAANDRTAKIRGTMPAGLPPIRALGGL
ncbi:hypothetical protein OG21DRAFT_1525776 [Imleria badia]|nr:hypothetical protein OG21DRAFT_1525776 [Imleria badia]